MQITIIKYILKILKKFKTVTIIYYYLSKMYFSASFIDALLLSKWFGQFQFFFYHVVSSMKEQLQSYINVIIIKKK